MKPAVSSNASALSITKAYRGTAASTASTASQATLYVVVAILQDVQPSTQAHPGTDTRLITGEHVYS